MGGLFSASVRTIIVFVGHSYRALKKLFWVIILPLFCFVLQCLFMNESQRNDFCFIFQLQLCSILITMLTKELNWSHSSCCPRFWRRKVHLIWGSPMASALLHLLPVLGLTGGRRFFPYRGQDLVPWMQQQPLHAIDKLLSMYLLVHVLTLASTKLLNFITSFKNPSWLLGKKTQLNKYHLRQYCEGSACCALHQIFIQELL